MNTMEQEIAEVRLRHLGQCPYEKGHDSGGIIGGALLGAAAMFVLLMIITGIQENAWEKWAIKAGAAHYDSYTGHIVYAPR